MFIDVQVHINLKRRVQQQQQHFILPQRNKFILQTSFNAMVQCCKRLAFDTSTSAAVVYCHHNRRCQRETQQQSLFWHRFIRAAARTSRTAIAMFVIVAGILFKRTTIVSKATAASVIPVGTSRQAVRMAFQYQTTTSSNTRNARRFFLSLQHQHSPTLVSHRGGVTTSSLLLMQHPSDGRPQEKSQQQQQQQRRALSNRNDDFLYLEEAMEQNSQSNLNRPFPPVLDSHDDDDGNDNYNAGIDASSQFKISPYENNTNQSDEHESSENLADTRKDEATAPHPEETAIVEESSLANQDTAEQFLVSKKKPTDKSTTSSSSITPPPTTEPFETHVHVGRILFTDEDAMAMASNFLERASYGTGATTKLESLKFQREGMEKAIYELNNGNQFNLSSPKQVSQVLFGHPNASTSKEALEMLAIRGNRLADLIIRYRRLSYDIKVLERNKELREKGTFVHSVVEPYNPDGKSSSQPATIKKKKTKKTTKSDEPSEQVDEQNSTIATTTSTSLPTEIVNSETQGTAALASPASDDDDDDSDESSPARGDPLLLVDASAYIFRAYYSMPPLHRGDGMPVGAVMGFCNMLNRLVLNRLLEGGSPRLVLVFDSKGKTFRHDLYQPYKGNRPDAPMDLIPQFALIREAAMAYGIHQLEAPEYEADDVIATLATMAKREGIDVHILSGDKDLMQLVTPENSTPCIHMIDPVSMSRITHDVVFEKWGVSPDKLGDVLALTGDSADNVPGVPGIGPKGASALIQEFGSLDQLLDRVQEVKQKSRRDKLQGCIQQARLSRKLIELECAIPLEKITFPKGMTDAADLYMQPLNGDRLLTFYDQMGFRDLKRRLQGRLLQLDKMKKSKKKFIPRRPKAEIPSPDDYKDVPF